MRHNTPTIIDWFVLVLLMPVFGLLWLLILFIKWREER